MATTQQVSLAVCSLFFCHCLTCLETTSDTLATVHGSLPTCTKEIATASDDSNKISYFFLNWSLFTPRCCFQRNLVCLVNQRSTFVFQLWASYLANGDKSADSERAQLSGGPQSITWSRRYVLSLSTEEVFITTSKGTCRSQTCCLSLFFEVRKAELIYPQTNVASQICSSNNFPINALWHLWIHLGH